jgi:hypothetical protein
MKKLLILLMMVSSPLYARGHHDMDNDSYSESSQRSEYYNRDDDDYEYRNRQNYNYQYTTRQSYTINVKPLLNTDGDCRKYKQYSSSGNSVNCDFDGNVQQYKEYSTHKR